MELSCRGEGIDLVSPNTALLAWLEQQTGKLQQSEIFADEAGEKPWQEISDLVRHVAKALSITMPVVFEKPPAEPSETNEPSAETPPSFQLQTAPRVDDESDSPAIILSAVLGLFPTAKQGLLRDTQAMLAESASGVSASPMGPVDAFLNASVDFDEPTAPLFQSQQVVVSPAKRQIWTDRLATAADPCQARAVALARETRGLVVHGPPGTGKSQTITNIIADHLSRGQRVLLVCEKRTALDVVADRLEHMGLRSLCGIVHDPQRDQRDLYRSIRQQLDELNELSTSAEAESKLTGVESEIRRLHGELTKYHQSLMSKRANGEPSFHELMGRWMAIRPSEQIRISEAAANAITPGELDARDNDLLNVLERAKRVDFGRNTWAKCVGVSLAEFLARPMETVRTALERCATAAASSDAEMNPIIPAFSVKAPLPLQATARSEIAERWHALLPNLNATVLTRWLGRDASSIHIARKKIAEIDSAIQMLRSSSLDADLKAISQPAPPAIATQLRAIDSYLEIVGKWYAIFSFGAKSEATKVFKQYGLPTTATEAARLKKYLLALRARLAIQQVRNDLTESTPEMIPADDILERFVTQHVELFELLLRFHDDTALDGLAKAASTALANPAAAESFIEGLRKSPARAAAIVKLEDELAAASLFDLKWLAVLGKKLRDGGAASDVTDALKSELDSLEGVLRVRQFRAELPIHFGLAADQLLAQSLDPAESISSLRKSVLAGEISRRLRDDPQLLGVDTHQIESNFTRYRELDAQKKKLVCDAIQHQWVSKQKRRLLSNTGAKKSSAGAELQSRLLMRGERAIRLRQVIAVGEKIEGGDPLFDVCPVWMASPETVAQVFPRKAVF